MEIKRIWNKHCRSGLGVQIKTEDEGTHVKVSWSRNKRRECEYEASTNMIVPSGVVGVVMIIAYKVMNDMG
jgi:hypothetical protein